MTKSLEWWLHLRINNMNKVKSFILFLNIELLFDMTNNLLDLLTILCVIIYFFV
jgi:hypothetical protein